jgi:cysteine synthase B
MHNIIVSVFCEIGATTPLNLLRITFPFLARFSHMNPPTPFTTQWLSQLDELAERVGHTPLVPITRAWQGSGVQLYAKLEWQQLAGSVKTRPAFRMIRDAIETGRLRPGMHLFDSTSGNTGISYAAIGAYLGIPVTIVMPADASQERKTIMRAMGAELLLTDSQLTSDEVFQYAQDLAAQHPDRYCYLNQYDNEANWRAHYETTAGEIYQQTEGRITHFVCGLGTCGTFTGTGRRLKVWNQAIQLIALHPDQADHAIEGWKHLDTSRHPRIFDAQLADQHLRISTAEAKHWMQHVARTEGWLLSPSSAAALAGAARLADTLETGHVVAMLPDDAAKYGAMWQQLTGAEGDALGRTT